MKNLFFLLAILCVISCTKIQNTPSQEVLSTFNPMAVGNYWVYQIFKEDNAGVFQATNQFDSTYIAADTVVSGKQYYKVVSTYGPAVDKASANHTVYLRDSLGYLISGFSGTKIFSSTDFTNELSRVAKVSNMPNDTIYVTIIKMFNNTSTATPLGSFGTITASQTQDIHPNYRSNSGRFRNYNTRFYAQNVGKIKEELCNYLDTPVAKEEKRLIRYHLNQQ
jgi:hypothetical protein